MNKAEKVFEKRAILGPFLDVNSLGIFSGIGYYVGKKHGNVERTIKPKRKYKTPVGPLAFAFLPGAIGYHFGYKKGFNLEKRAFDTDYSSLSEDNKRYTYGVAWTRRGPNTIKSNLGHMKRLGPDTKVSFGITQKDVHDDKYEITGKNISISKAQQFIMSKYDKTKGSAGHISATVPSSGVSGAALRGALQYRRPKGGPISKWRQRSEKKKMRGMSDEQLKLHLLGNKK